MSGKESKDKRPESDIDNILLHSKPLLGPRFGHTSQLRSPLAANKAFNIPKKSGPRPEHHRSNDDRPRYPSGSDSDVFQDPVEMMNKALSSQGAPIPMRMPVGTQIQAIPKALPVKYSSFQTPFSRFGADDSLKKELQFQGMSQVDAALFADKYNDYANLQPVDPVKAAKDVKALLEGAFDDSDGKPKIRKLRRRLVSPSDSATKQTRAVSVDSESQADSQSLEGPEPVGEDDDEEEEEEILDDGTRPGLKVKLLPHQIDGVEWMLKKEIGTGVKDSVTNGGILADDMGLGKTIQTISLLLLNPRPKPKESKLPKTVAKTTLVVAPLALIKQWERELEERVEDSHYLKVLVHHGAKRTRRGADLQKYDVVITTYQTITSECSDKDDGPQIGCFDVHWYRVILDEAHTIKNRNAKCTKGCYKLRAEYRWCLTGTPMQNHLAELHSLISFLQVKQFSEKNFWKEQILDPMNKGRTDLAIRRLQAMLKTIMKRRTKDVLREQAGFGTGAANTEGFKLVGRDVKVVTVKFTPKELNFYKKLQQRADWNIERMMSAEAMNFAGALALLLRLRQACNHKELIKKSLGSDPDAMEVVARQTQFAPLTKATKTSQSSSQDIDLLANLLGGLEVDAKKCELCGDELSVEETSSKMDRCVDCEALLVDDEPDHKPLSTKGRSDEKHKANAVQDTRQKRGNRPIIEDSSDEESGDWLVPESQRLYPNLSKAGGQDDEDAEGGGEWLSGNDSDTDDDSKQITRKSQTKSPPQDDEPSIQYEEDDSVLSEGNQGILGVSTKIQAMLKILRKEVSQHKFIVFSEWTSMLNILEPFLREEEISYCRYDGKMKNDAREASLSRLRNDPDTRVLLCSLKCGSLGLNLTAASRVIIMEPFWNPFVEEQAIDRVHRLNQTKDVVVYRLTVEATVEQRIFDLQNQKRELADAALEGKEITKLSMNELLNLFKHNAEDYVKGTKLGDFMLGQGPQAKETAGTSAISARVNTQGVPPRAKEQAKTSSRPEHAIYGRRW